MEIPDGVIITSIGAICGALCWSVKSMIGNLKTTISDNAEIYEERMVKQEAETAECKRERKVIIKAHSDLTARTAIVEKALGIAKLCPMTDCPNRQLLKATSPVETV